MDIRFYIYPKTRSPHVHYHGVHEEIAFYEAQSEDEAVTEDERGLAVGETLMQVPVDLVAEVRALIAKEQAKH